MQVKANARNLRISSRKVRLVIDLIRGARAEKAQTQLRFLNKVAAEPVLKLLNSAIANAEHNFHLKKEDLKVAKITADEGPTLDRWMPRAHGRANPIRKRSTHLAIVLETVEPKEKGTKATNGEQKQSKATKSNQKHPKVKTTKPSKKENN